MTDVWSPEIGDDSGTVRACRDGGHWYFLSIDGGTVTLVSR